MIGRTKIGNVALIILYNIISFKPIYDDKTQGNPQHYEMICRN